ncbi:hypothetical protein PORUE0001_0010 [Porphyromonas uenonis 60-3]|uniref:Uncharacterized protein n=1 Tax=Porphyromonas uenonis 60-3 TaxID=596327 RepID=C2MA60_9PORP|nr:hypothetical protein PORUE0001_0010 [Porphyromonas uenonis 60-3]
MLLAHTTPIDGANILFFISLLVSSPQGFGEIGADEQP